MTNDLYWRIGWKTCWIVSLWKTKCVAAMEDNKQSGQRLQTVPDLKSLGIRAHRVKQSSTACRDLKKFKNRRETKSLTCINLERVKAISKALGLQQTTVRAIIHKCRKLVTVVYLPRSGRPTKITPRAQRRLIQEITKEPRTTSKELQASLASIKVSVHDSTIRKRLGKNGIHGRVPRQKTLLNKNNTKACLTFSKKIS